MKFGPEKQVEIFKALSLKPMLQVGIDYGFDKVYSNPRSIRTAVYKIYAAVKNNPEQYGVSPDVVKMVCDSMNQRINKPTIVAEGASVAERREGDGDIKNVVLSIRDKSFRLIDMKLDRVGKSKKKLDQVTFKDLAVIAGVAFDKAQILKGEATEHIAVHAKIDKEMTPEAAFEALMTMREKVQVDKERTK